MKTGIKYFGCGSIKISNETRIVERKAQQAELLVKGE
jgi:hypothetical protein